MSQNQPTLVVISEDPRVSHRANEAIRIALGIVVVAVIYAWILNRRDPTLG